jgi:hypothetical protein
MKIIDCFTFYNELDLLNYRLNILNNVVDYFIIVESTHTHVGKEKNLIYEENKGSSFIYDLKNGNLPLNGRSKRVIMPMIFK